MIVTDYTTYTPNLPLHLQVKRLNKSILIQVKRFEIARVNFKPLKIHDQFFCLSVVRYWSKDTEDKIFNFTLKSNKGELIFKNVCDHKIEEGIRKIFEGFKRSILVV